MGSIIRDLTYYSDTKINNTIKKDFSKDVFLAGHNASSLSRMLNDIEEARLGNEIISFGAVSYREKNKR
jgi:hypothetical protein